MEKKQVISLVYIKKPLSKEGFVSSLRQVSFLPFLLALQGALTGVFFRSGGTVPVPRPKNLIMNY
jgi:hypothetical protein